ncbi:NADPH:quinone oxidoreductase family protein [Betaproteobacteria bacterium PRO7]|jgi:NADPH2:quinone reductase|nr:NADPH:quinone oxidoreductase family protein [Betaproteobacteria bacterium PRO7]
MKAIVCSEWGGPDKLRLGELPLPDPKAGEVRLKVLAAGVNFPDALLIQKKYQLQPPLPFVPGTEVAGMVDAVGEGVSLAKGTRVVAFVGTGGFAEYVCVNATLTIPLPTGVSDEVAAGFTMTYATSQHALFDRAQLKAGETLLVLGAGGGVGLAAVELGKLAGARVIAAASTDEKLAACHAAGADALINYSTLDLRESVKTLTDGKGADVVYDPVGGGYTEPALRALAWRGRLLVVGFANGEIPSLRINLLLLKEASLVGVYWGEFAKREPKANARMIGELMGWLAQGKLKPRVSHVYPLHETPRALDELLHRRAIGKLVIRP